MSKLPTTMRALELSSQEGEQPRPVLVEKAVPTPRHGEVLIRVAAAPINPNDLLFLRDRYDVKKPLPVVPGFEGSGTVVGVGGGFIARTMLGRRVACAAGEGDGTWAEYVCAPAMQCAPLRGSVDLVEGATMLTNPLTAWVLVNRARREGHRAVVLTAAAGALGQMLHRLFRQQGMNVVQVVRRKSQVELLRKDGGAHVLDSTDVTFDEELRKVCLDLSVSLALDAVGGEMTGRIFAALPAHSLIRVYGMLSDNPCKVDASELVFRSKRIEGFTMYEWLRTTSLLGQLYAIMKVQGMVGGILKTQVRARFSLDDHDEALTMATAGGSEGKVLFVPSEATT